ncbi:hypothetical protein MBN61_02725, partial [Candidatus Saccharibacteria bacterium]|nr:hypothetical protein [Candidatus Saccharibacteria bacterium]
MTKKSSSSKTKTVRSNTRGSSETGRRYATYSGLAKIRGKSQREINKERKLRRKAEYLATLPKNPAKRLLARLNPRHLAKFWFSMDGLKMLGKIFGIALLLMVLVGIGTYFY